MKNKLNSRVSLIAIICVLIGGLAFLAYSFVNMPRNVDEGTPKIVHTDSIVYPFSFRDVGSVLGLIPEMTKILGHSAAWGDVNGDGWPDLYIGTFNDEHRSKTNMLFINKNGRFALSDQKSVRISTRATGSIFVDLDNDGDLDLYVGSMPKEGKGDTPRTVGNSLFENDGKGQFTNISENNGACPLAFGGRSATVLDYDGDGLLDILAGEDPATGYNGSKTHSFRLFHNEGNLAFRDVTAEAGLPLGIPGYGVASADINNDGWPDFFVACQGGSFGDSSPSNKLFINDRDGTFTEVKNLNTLFEWPGTGGDKMVCGVSFGDINKDGNLDIALGPHFIVPGKNPQPVRLFLNQGNDMKGMPKFTEITEEAGLRPIHMKLPHLEIQDMDNDGFPDITTSAVRFKDGKPFPVIYRNTGSIKNGIPIFEDFKINDYPTEEDVKIEKSSEFWDKTLSEGKIIYGAPAPVADFNKDGKLDLFMASWWPEKPSLLLQNESVGDNWLQVVVKGPNGVNSMGIGAKVKIYLKGKLGIEDHLLGTQDISVGHGYASGQQAIAHFGLGEHNGVDVEVILPNGKGKLSHRNVGANQRINIR
ncbi:MAG: FG-GAP-like repeat-containing protein [Sediminicola sp.]